MAYDEKLASRVRQALTRRAVIEERAMFGGVAFMARGHMCCGVVTNKLMVRINPDAYDALLTEPGARPMDFTGRSMRGFLYVSSVGISTPSALNRWIERALSFAESRPPKSPEKLQAKAAKRPNKPLQPTHRTVATKRHRSSARG